MKREFAWLGFASCGHVRFASVEDADGPDADLFTELARLRKDGRRVERLSWEEAKVHVSKMKECNADCPRTEVERAAEKRYEAQRKKRAKEIEARKAMFATLKAGNQEYRPTVPAPERKS